MKLLIAFLPVVLLVTCLCSNQNPVAAKPDLSIKQLSIDQIIGKYSLFAFNVVYTNGLTVSNATPGLTWNGTMNISESGDVVQYVTINGNNVTAISKILSIPTDSTMNMLNGGQQYVLVAHYSLDTLIIYLDGTQLGLSYSETDKWLRTSNTLSKREAVFSNENTLFEFINSHKF